ncbi:DUF2789 domain-containing protein [Exilibacterium tricleocarpae]|uniref:DUF2789 domain-containing protein n=1 Tax=Exilibacterium tricleocarpae TaxID=2591008 RepID=A0A545UA18_9GAMM|nr:DUF2789 domain-containing protein [Exilibacterium tricleocarpae]TQV86312.1 DUF2789 domain-containing protein [Exilibacterium tricleocarpae]
MDTFEHSLNTLFEQLGLPGSDSDIEAFVARHRPLARAVTLPNASFWNQHQADFIREAIEQDSDWTEWVDQLDAMLRH